MRKLTSKMSWVVLATVALAVGSASAAQAQESHAVAKAKVPFAFIVGDTLMPAGNYVVRELPGALVITRTDHPETAYTLTISSSSSPATPNKPELVFHRFSNEYFLAAVKPPDGDAREIVLTPRIMERDIAKATERAAD